MLIPDRLVVDTYIVMRQKSATMTWGVRGHVAFVSGNVRLVPAGMKVDVHIVVVLGNWRVVMASAQVCWKVAFVAAVARLNSKGKRFNNRMVFVSVCLAMRSSQVHQDHSGIYER